MAGTLINYHCFNLSKVPIQTGNHRSLWLVFTFKSYRRLACPVYVHTLFKSLDSHLLSIPSTLGLALNNVAREIKSKSTGEPLGLSTDFIPAGSISSKLISVTEKCLTSMLYLCYRSLLMGQGKKLRICWGGI